MTSQLFAVTFGAHDPGRLALFWAGLLDREVVADDGGVLLPGSSSQVGLRFASTRAEKRGPNRAHLHVTSEGSDQETVVARAVGLGARHLDVGQLPEEPHVVLGDPEGNELCVIPPDNDFLAGCGCLGEIACDGTRAVGLFWSAALDWPLAWDENEETAVQSPHGGTKVAWGGPPVAPLQVPARQWFELLVEDDLDREAERLVSLGATAIGARRVGGRSVGGRSVGGRSVGGDGGDVVVLADPDGNEFRLRTDQRRQSSRT